eukprot:m.969972 g.969972  ORF g.969972 m.969972 type:complete len:57 (-) comp505892_c0_seq1:6-176(-)
MEHAQWCVVRRLLQSVHWRCNVAWFFSPRGRTEVARPTFFNQRADYCFSELAMRKF